MRKLKKSYIIIFALIVLSIVCFSASYAFLTSVNEQHGKLNIVAGTLDYKIESSDLVDNQITVAANDIKEIKIKLTSLNTINSKYELYYILDQENSDVKVGYHKDTKDSVLGTIEANSNKEITVVINNESSMNTTVTFSVIGGLINNELALKEGNSLNQVVNGTYSETILNGTDPVLTSNLIPVQIADDGTVTRAGLDQEWYKYENKNWANAVVLKDTSTTYNNGEIIPETNIESYFVWIPKYSYQLWDLGNYDSLTSISSKEQTINIKFGLTNTNDSNMGECTTPGISGEKGNCKVGDYMTHPSFLAFNTNGFWVGKFETGYNGATSTSAAEVNSNDSSKIIIKPNVYSWRSLTLGNMFKASYDYLRSDESHMMKNTEWGAVAYLSHSLYGTCTGSECSEVRINNNSSFITGYAGTTNPTKGYNGGTSTDGNRVEGTALATDGTYTLNYLNVLSNIASTTLNKSGVYDMSGGAWEYVMGYTTGSSIGVGGASGITSIYSDFFTNINWTKYYDTVNTNYNNRILGDATGEMGPFGSEKDPDGNTRYKSSWYKYYAYFVNSSNPWFHRGGCWYYVSGAGAFAFGTDTGGVYSGIGFRIVLAP